MGSPITTHILDTAHGHPAAGVAIALERRIDGAWSHLGNGVTNDDGRVSDLLPDGAVLEPGTYRLRFAVGDYFERRGIEAFYDEVPVVFVIRSPDPHYHVPLLLNPFGYSTYRGS